MTTPHSSALARNVSLLLAAVGVPYTLLIVHLVQRERAEPAFYLACFIPPIVALPAAWRAHRLTHGAMPSASTIGTWIRSVLTAGAIVVAAHAVFFCVWLPGQLIAGDRMLYGLSNHWVWTVGPWVLGTLLAALVADRMAARYLSPS
ncbi:MAG: hypothetical protein U0746_15700 [Gemmataceae bacterium]